MSQSRGVNESVLEKQVVVFPLNSTFTEPGSLSGFRVTFQCADRVCSGVVWRGVSHRTV